jgi:hypothetical protein
VDQQVKRQNQWLRVGLPGLAIIGFGYFARASSDEEYATEDLHRVLLIVLVVVVVIGLVQWARDNL